MLNRLFKKGKFMKSGIIYGMLASLFLIVITDVAIGQERHSHANSHGHDHTHLPVDYSFHSDAGEYSAPVPDEEGYYWWKGNLHTHTLWSDGDQFPEVVTQWYYEHGYHFLALSDHNILSRGVRWLDLYENHFINRGGGTVIYDIYKDRFGEEWVETRIENGVKQVRVKPLQEVRTLFEKPQRFILIESEEISQSEHNVHVNATNILELIEPKTGNSIEETIRLNFDAVNEQRNRTGQEMIPNLNHPNWRASITAEDMMPVENLRLFELYNGHRGVLNYGNDEGEKDLERVWDIILSSRLGVLNLGLVFGIAGDDAHHYETSTQDVAEPGRGWVQVRTKFLTPENVVRALEKGEFYSSTGVTIRTIQTDGNQYNVEVEPEEGVEYTIQFIGTYKNFDSSSEPFLDGDGEIRNDKTRLYSDEIGQVLKEVHGPKAAYEFNGNELYVRAKVISSRPKKNYFVEGEREKAWLQPVVP